MDDGRNRSIWIIIGGLLLVFVIGSAGGGKSKSTPPPPKPLDNARAVLLPGGDGVDRTLLVPPCGAPPPSAKGSVRTPTPDAVTLQVAAGPAARVVLVPDCIAKRAGAFKANAVKSSAAFVLPVGSQSPRSPALKVGAQTQILVPRGSPAATLIVPPCTGAAPKRNLVLSPAPGATEASAQQC